MNRFRSVTIAFASLAFLLQACDQIGAAAPDSVVLKYLNAQLEGNYREAYSLISSKDHAVKTVEEFGGDDGGQASEIGKTFITALKDKMSHRIVSTKEEGNSATVEVEVTMPNFAAMMFGALANAMGLEKKEREKAVEEKITELSEKNEIPMMTSVSSYALIKEDGKWRIFLDLEGEKRKAEKTAQEKTRRNLERELLRDAKKLKQDRKLADARKKYHEVLAFDAANVKAIEGIEDIDNQEELGKLKRAYLKKIDLYDFEAGKIETYSGREAGVRFKLKNRGDRILSLVEVTVYFQNASGTTIFEKDFHPVASSLFSFGSENIKLLKPNYIWQLPSGRYFTPENVPDDWQPGKAFAKITEIEFEKYPDDTFVIPEQPKSENLKTPQTTPTRVLSKNIGDKFRDCAECPEMVVVPKGDFMMGSNLGDSKEKPVHSVSISKPFVVGVYEVTFDEFDACVSGGSCYIYRLKSSVWSKGRHPMTYVNWQDAKAYVSWLSDKTSQTYRLLSEAEWEYVARAGTTSAFSWGHTANHERANYGRDKCCGGRASGKDRWLRTSPVGSFPANVFGLHDVHGNVWEWVEDCYHANYSGSPEDGRVWSAGECSKHVLRGGSWYFDPWVMRSAYRSGDPSMYRLDGMGFRLARDLN